LTIAPVLDRQEIVEFANLPVYKAPVRGVYKHTVDEKMPWLYSKEATGVKNLPKRISGLTYVVSREALRIITRENDKVRRREELQIKLKQAEKVYKYLVENCSQADILFAQETVIRDIENELEQNKTEFKTIRNDFVAPGDQLKEPNTGKIIACAGLIKEIR
jgi:hypothetical protein